MHLKECYVSHNGISCITNINTLHDIKEINYMKFSYIKNNIVFYMSLRFVEFIIKDFLKNKNFLKSINDNNDSLLNYIIFN